MDQEIYNQIIKKKEFSDLPKKDVELAWKHFEKRQTSDEDKIDLTRDLLRKVFSAFASKKLLSLRQKLKLLTASSKRGQSKDKELEWILKKHISTKERLDFYEELYSKLLKGKKYNVIDLGAGINGLSYKFFGDNLEYYFGVEAMGQLVDLSNYYFVQNKLNGKCSHESLFELEKIKKLIREIKGVKIIFLFKTLDSLEMLERNYSKKLLLELVPLVDKVVVSFATRSLVSHQKFKVNRNWILSFIKENFNLLEDFELGGERYLVFGASQLSAIK